MKRNLVGKILGKIKIFVQDFVPIRTLGQQYNVGEKPTVILYIYINRHAGFKMIKQGLHDERLTRSCSCNSVLKRLFRVESSGLLKLS